jgi:hypothetical protein
VNASYTVTSTDPYTGEIKTQLLSNNSIELTITNQNFSYTDYQLFFNFRAKPHYALYEDNWTEVYPLQNRTSNYSDGKFSYAEYLWMDSPNQSSSTYTIITFPVVITDVYGASGYDIQRYYSNDSSVESYLTFLYSIPYNGQIDFQIEALVGHNSQKWVSDHPLSPYVNGYLEPAIAFDTSSGWTSTKTVMISDEPVNQEPVPTTSVPEIPFTAILVFFTIATSIAVMSIRKNHKPILGHSC